MTLLSLLLNLCMPIITRLQLTSLEDDRLIQVFMIVHVHVHGRAVTNFIVHG